MSKQTELAWAAGFFDGEGTTVCTVNNGYPHSLIQMRVSQADDDEQIAKVLIRFEAAVGVGKVYNHCAPTATHRRVRQWVVCKTSDVIRCMELLTPYLSGRKLKQIEKCLALYEESTGEPYGG
jgi:hypothetical protein